MMLHAYDTNDIFIITYIHFQTVHREKHANSRGFDVTVSTPPVCVKCVWRTCADSRVTGISLATANINKHSHKNLGRASEKPEVRHFTEAIKKHLFRSSLAVVSKKTERSDEEKMDKCKSDVRRLALLWKMRKINEN